MNTCHRKPCRFQRWWFSQDTASRLVCLKQYFPIALPKRCPFHPAPEFFLFRSGDFESSPFPLLLSLSLWYNWALLLLHRMLCLRTILKHRSRKGKRLGKVAVQRSSSQGKAPWGSASWFMHLETWESASWFTHLEISQSLQVLCS